MEVKNIIIKSNLNTIPNIENAWCDVYVTLDDDRTYIFQVLTYQNWILNYKLTREILYVKKKKMIRLSLLYLVFYG